MNNEIRRLKPLKPLLLFNNPRLLYFWFSHFYLLFNLYFHRPNHIPNIEIGGMEYSIYNSLDIYDAETREMSRFKKVKVNEYPSEKGDKRWIITAEDSKVLMVTKSYCKETFSFTNNFNFRFSGILRTL